MLKKIMIILGIIFAIVAIIIIFSVYYFKPNEHTTLDFIKEHPEKAAIKFVRNDSILASQNPNTVMPLASTVKIIIAIEYAEQASKGMVNPDSLIPLTALDQFYVANTDGGAHPKWLKSVESNIQDDKISIREIAKGMIKYSSNANTEWLLMHLGLANVQQQLGRLGTQDHTPMQYIVSALFVGKERFPDLKGSELETALRGMSEEEYHETILQIHEKLKSDTTYKKELGDLSMEIQKVWSDNLPAATVTDYVTILKKINSRTYFDPQAQAYLDEVMEFLLENPANKKWLAHTGMKGGSTAFVLTKALYATDKKGNKTELAYFFNELDQLESTRLRMSLNEFELKILSSATFREQVLEAFKE